MTGVLWIPSFGSREREWPRRRFQTSHSRRCEWRPRQCHPDRSEPQRRYPIAAARRCHCADRGYDSEPHRRKLRQRGIEPVIAKRRTEHGSGLGNFAGWSSALTHGSTTFVVFAFALSVAADIHEEHSSNSVAPSSVGTSSSLFETVSYSFIIRVAHSFSEPGRGRRHGIRRALAHQSTKKDAAQPRKTP
jgi:hypothetical protein